MRRRGAAVLLALAASVAHGGWWDDAGAARRATVAELRSDPDRWRDVTILLDVEFERMAEPGNPYFTRFTAADWRALCVVAAGREPFERLFVRRGSQCEERLAAKLRKGRVEVRGAVRDTAKGEPWIEVFDVTGDGDPLTPEEDALLARGRRLLAASNPAAAEETLRELAARRVLPQAATAALWRDIGEAAWAGRRIAEAAEAFRTSLAADPEDVGTAARLSAAREALRVAAEPRRTDARGEPRRLLPPSGLMGDAAPAEQPPPPPAAPETAPPKSEPAAAGPAPSPMRSTRDKSVAPPPRPAPTVAAAVVTSPAPKQTAAEEASPPPPPPGPPEAPPPPPPPPPAPRGAGLSGPI